MRHIKPYQIFEASASAAALTAVQINWLDKCVEGSWKLNPQTGLVDVDENFDCSEQGLTDFKGVRFGKVSGYFNCYNNQLTTLEGAPQSVGSSFRCTYNQLTSLVGAPQSVGGGFSCDGNQLTTLKGAPQTPVEFFVCSYNVLTSLVGAPQVVDGVFHCDNNQLTTLEGAPQKVKENFRCERNQLTSLVGAPKTVNGGFDCYSNQLTTLEGAPQSVGGDFYCNDNPVSETTLASILALMEKGKSYQQALEERWPKMKDVDRAVLYKQMPDLSPEDVRKYKALATYNNIKGYL